MAYSRATLVSRIRRVVNDAPFFDICTEAMDTTETGLSVADTTYWSVGDVVEFQDDGEQCLVTALASATELTVVRNYNFSVGATAGTGTSHSISAQIAKNPIFQYAQITNGIEGVLQSMWPTVYYVQTQSITPVDGTKWYNATADAIGVIQAVQIHTDSITPKFYNGRGGSYPCNLVHGLPVGTFASTKAWNIPYLFNTTNTILVTFAQTMDDSFSTPNYTRLDDGLAVEATIYLVAADLVQNTEVIRVTDQDTQMNDQTVTPGQRTGIAGRLRDHGQMKKQQEALRLAAQFPLAPQWHGRA